MKPALLLLGVAAALPLAGCAYGPYDGYYYYRHSRHDWRWNRGDSGHFRRGNWNGSGDHHWTRVHDWDRDGDRDWHQHRRH